jgi:hypothetical protein
VGKDKVKEISILLGAGFSKSLADLPLVSGLLSLSSYVLKAFNNDSRLKERFKNTKENFNYEKFAQYLENIRDQSSFATELGLDSLNLDDGEIEKLNLCEEILYKILLDKLLSVDYAEKFKKMQKSFVDLVKALLADGYKLHFFDLNHDLLLDKIFSDEEGLLVENFFKVYEEFMPTRGYFPLEKIVPKNTLETKFRRSKSDIARDGLSFFVHRDFTSEAETNLFHYKPHGALNFIYLLGLPVKISSKSSHDMAGLHLLYGFKSDGKPDYGKTFRDNLKKVFNNRISQIENIRCQPAILNQGNNKASILTRDFLYYFPEVYSRFISLGEKGVPLLTIGYGFQDSHFNTAIRYHYKTSLYSAYQDNKAKILFSGYEEIPLITDKLKTISLDDSSGLTRNEFGRKVFCSDRNFEEFLAV